jgi:hypothetical protein
MAEPTRRSRHFARSADDFLIRVKSASAARRVMASTSRFVETRLALGIGPEEVHLASRCRRGYWWMSGNGIVQRALDNTWLAEQGVPNLRQQWIALHYGHRNPHWNPAAVNLTGTA